MHGDPIADPETGALLGAKPWHAASGIRDADLPWYAKLVAFVLLSRAGVDVDAGAWACFPSLPTIARDAGISVASVQRGLRALGAAGLVTWHQDREGGVNHYALDCDAMAALRRRRVA